MNSRVLRNLRIFYNIAVEAVKPENLINDSVKISNNVLSIQDKYELTLNNNCYVVGFGKAVLGMAVQLEKTLGSNLKRVVLSVPHGLENYNLPSNFEVFEGALHNIPDADSVRATQSIKSLVKTLTEDDVLLVLISGGGSALLVSPIDDLTLEEKQLTTRLLSQAGATINELNTVRKRLSDVKGGNLAQLSYPADTVSLILSDVIDNPLTVIASGPTVQNPDNKEEALTVIRKFCLEEKIPAKVLEIIKRDARDCEEDFSHVNNFLIGSNLTALLAAEKKAVEEGYLTLILSDSVQGEASLIGENFATLGKLLKEMLLSEMSEHCFINELSVILENLNVNPSICCKLERLVRKCSINQQNLCLIAGGETTVKVSGSGLGGRNQEMVLSFLAHSETLDSKAIDVIFMSAGTDGADGPTDAAGALTGQSAKQEASDQGLDPHVFLHNNDSYNFFKSLSGGAYHIRDGPTGTNVMDIQILCIAWI